MNHRVWLPAAVLCLVGAHGAPTSGQDFSTGIFVAPLEKVEGGLRLGAAEPIAPEPGYDNQPMFVGVSDDAGERLLFTSQRAGEQTEIYRYDFKNARLDRLTDTPESEYSPTPLPSGGGFSVVRVEAGGTQRLWRFDDDGSNPRLLIEKLAPVGYHAWAGAAKPQQLITFVLSSVGEPQSTLRRVDLASDPTGERATIVARGIGRALHRVPNRESWSFVASQATPGEPADRRWVHELSIEDGSVTPFAPTFDPEGEHDLAWTPDGVLVMAKGSVLARWDAESSSWLPIHDFAAQGITGISRLAINAQGTRIAFVAAETDGRSIAERFAAGMALVAEAREKGTAGDWKAARHALDRAAKFVPPQAGVQRRRAGAAARDGRLDQAWALLEPLVAWRARVDLTADPDLEALRGAKLDALQTRLSESLAPSSKASLAFRAGPGDFVPEGITHDPVSGAFYLGSLRKGVVLRRTASGEESIFASVRAAGFGSVVGMAIDPSRRRLWVAASDLPPSDTFDERPEANRKTALCGFDLDSGRLVGCFGPPPGGVEGAVSRFDDVAVAGDGTVYVSDAAPAVHRLVLGARALERWLDAGSVRAPNGLALSTAGNALYVADYGLGPLRVDRETRAVARLAVTGLPPLIGIDGLVRWRTSLIAVQNGVVPARILRLDLAPDGRAVERVQTLELGRADWDEPTLGVVAEGDYYYVSNSHWPRFGEDGALKDGPPLEAPAILRLEAADLGAD